MNFYSMSLEDRMRYGIEAEDVDDIWEQFDLWVRGTTPPKEDVLYEQETEYISLQEEHAAENRRDNAQECWLIESERQALCESLRSEIVQDNEYER